MNTTACSAGFAKLDITPPLGVHIGGYYRVRVTKGVRDPIFVRAMAFREGEKTAVLMVCDLLGMYGPAAYEWPPKIAEKLGLPVEAVFVCHTHSHTTPVVTSYREPHDDQYDAWLYRRLCDAAQLAIDDLKPITDVRAAETMTENITFVRRFRMKDGSVMTNPHAPEEVAAIQEPAHDGDVSLRLVRILREDAPELILVNFQTHPDNIGGEKISADFPGAMCRRVEELAPNSRAIYINGAEGQMIALDRTQPFPKGDLYPRAMGIGVAIADKAMELYEKTAATGMTGLAFGQKPVHAKTKRGMMPLEEALRIIELFESGRTNEIHPDPQMAGNLPPEAYLIRELEKYEQDYIDFPVSAIAFCGVAFVGMPGEPFCEVGRQVRGNSNYPMTFVACQTNGCYGYFPTAQAYDDGGYEPRNTRYVRGTAEQLADTADALLAEL